jgi:nicotinamide-nucleotide amidase
MDEQRDLAITFLKACSRKGIMAATAESCTGGMIVAALTDIAGSSAVVDRGFVTYSNEAKMDMLGVSRDTLATHGAVSRETVLEMAEGALRQSRAGVTIAVTGIAGPDGGSAEKPVGLVWFGIGRSGQPASAKMAIFENRGRDFIRSETVAHALRLAIESLDGVGPAGQ